ncbi:hypothetical protein CRENBAI_007778 [Crenichthys baileyi]|uniref:Uncharacterized protein n=1 Tax=Crenichthys baileyi TaxID=28760 RepID=A0AAV9S5E2_9TELE
MDQIYQIYPCIEGSGGSQQEIQLLAIQTRFAGVLDDKDALLAAVVSCPKFKLQWLRDAGRRERVKELLITECRTTAPALQLLAKVRWPFSLLRQSQRRPTLQNSKSWTTLGQPMAFKFCIDFQTMHFV